MSLINFRNTCYFSSAVLTGYAVAGLAFPQFQGRLFAVNGLSTPLEAGISRMLGSAAALSASLLCGVASTKDEHTQRVTSQSVASGFGIAVASLAFVTATNKGEWKSPMLIGEGVLFAAIAATFAYLGLCPATTSN